MTSKQLQENRKRIGITQKQAAEILCVGKSTYIGWENKKPMPKIAEKLFCIIYDIPFKDKKHKKAFLESPDLF